MQTWAKQTTDDRPRWDWLDAGPFRAHVRHLMQAGDVEARVIATLAGVSARGVHHLLHGRPDSSVVRRICPQSAARLLRISPHQVAGLRFQPVPADTATRHLAWLRRCGWSDVRLAASLGLQPGLVEAMLDGRVAECSRLVALRAKAARDAAEAAIALAPQRLEPVLHPESVLAA